MPRKKKTEKKETVKKEVTVKEDIKTDWRYQNINGVDTLCLSREHLLEIELSLHKHTSYLEGKKARLAKVYEVERKALDEIGRLKTEAATLEQKAIEEQDNYKRTFNKLAEVYEVEPGKWGYDDVTGKITIFEDNIKSKQKKKEKKTN